MFFGIFGGVVFFAVELQLFNLFFQLLSQLSIIDFCDFLLYFCVDSGVLVCLVVEESLHLLLRPKKRTLFLKNKRSKVRSQLTDFLFNFLKLSCGLSLFFVNHFADVEDFEF